MGARISAAHRFIGTCSLLATCAITQARVVLFEDFEDDNIALGAREMCCSHSFARVRDNARAGNGAGKFEIRKGDKFESSGPRSEYRIGLSVNRPGRETWVGFSAFVPSNFEGRHTRIMQWHGEFMLVYGNGKTGLEVNARECGGKPVNPYPTGNLILGKWVDWVIHHKWSCGNDGFVVIYRNKQKFLEWKGPTWDAKTSHNFKVGIYGTSDYGNWSTQKVIADRWLLLDEIRVGDGTSNLEEVSPRKETTTNLGAMTPDGVPGGISTIPARFRGPGAPQSLAAYSLDGRELWRRTDASQPYPIRVPMSGGRSSDLMLLNPLP